MVEVDFGPSEKLFKRVDLLEPVVGPEDIFDLMASGSYGGPIDLRHALIFEKIKGNLTNVLYSMEASNTDFYPHQFKPVLKFIESPVGRLLIADEVGLGKTIEAIYVWKELQARHDARRLLIICPAMLREKWRGDLRRKFNIAADIVSAGDLLRKARDVVEHGTQGSFVLITSLEGLRPPTDFNDKDKTDTRAQFARLLDQNSVSEEFAIFDLVVIDEAHDLRNPSTASHRLGRLVRDASRHMLLLTATPIQISSDNLYQLLRLIDPDQFYDAQLFQELIKANEPVVRSLRHLWRNPPDIEQSKAAVATALDNQFFSQDAVLKRVHSQLLPDVREDLPTRIELGRLLEARSLLGQYMVRSRKREVLESRVERSAQVVAVRLSPKEREIYRRVTARIRNAASQAGGVSVFALMARQRQMASSIVAALVSWRDQGVLSELIAEEFLGRLPSEKRQFRDIENGEMSVDDILAGAAGTVSEDVPAKDVEIADLEASDSKYQALRSFLLDALARNPAEKFVLFSFFRGTLRYLERRLREDNVRTGLIMGGMGDERQMILEAFERLDGPSLLLSSEVGSEGIDLQFCRIIINYDLPWNPMRVEQRIGRLDRLGQKADKISIVNLALTDTIEDRILLRLYDRIELFRDSIGDLEEILGDMAEQIMYDLLQPDLTDEERDRRARQTEQAILYRRAEQEKLEREAVNLIGFSDFILDTIKAGRAKGRWIAGDDLRVLVDDFFARHYIGTQFEPHSKISTAINLTLSDEARDSLAMFVNETRPATRTRLHQLGTPIPCIFDPRRAGEFGHNIELIEPTHPLIQWIRQTYMADGRHVHPTAAIRLRADRSNVPPGTYAFVTHRWSFEGLRGEHILVHRAAPIGSDTTLGEATSEELVGMAARFGEPFPNAINLIGDQDQLMRAAVACETVLDTEFAKRLGDFAAENEMRCDHQETSARKFAERRIHGFEERLTRFRMTGAATLIPMTEGLIRREETQLNVKLAKIRARRTIDPTMVRLMAGAIRVS